VQRGVNYGDFYRHIDSISQHRSLRARNKIHFASTHSLTTIHSTFCHFSYILNISCPRLNIIWVEAHKQLNISSRTVNNNQQTSCIALLCGSIRYLTGSSEDRTKPTSHLRHDNRLHCMAAESKGLPAEHAMCAA
jgi:hypothetical protein